MDQEEQAFVTDNTDPVRECRKVEKGQPKKKRGEQKENIKDWD